MKKQLANSFKARMGMAGAFASAMLFVVPAFAQDSRLSLADRVSRLEQQAQNQNQGGTTLVNQVQALQSQLQQMQGQIEELQHQLQEANDKNKAQATDFDSRLGRLEGGAGAAANNPGNAANANTPPPAGDVPQAPAPAPDAGKGGKAAGAAAGAAAGTAAATKGGAAPANSAGAQAVYDEAFKSLRAGDYVVASRGFRGFIQQYPDSPLLPNAYYWLGESYYVTMNYSVALEAFQRLLSQFPQSEKAPDAMLKVGYSQIELKQVDAGKATLKSVTAKFPGSKAAGLAQERLRRLQAQPAN
ncbi:tol-pal system protein YbgF [Dyella amyloliquefaciens]|uniref:tol-pal system protein YbgF n=1 Tax=Dyella amyloliquefaciens TaxID=1770545 RepID=UPI00197AEB36|nr:tol-pal system protein YbgF [Dyella amyloliquefaciens]